VDLDNAMVSPTLNAAAQQFAIVVSNASIIAAQVVVDEDDALPGQPAQLRTVATARVLPGNLEVFKLGPREVDGSAEGTFNTGTHTALTRHAYRVRSTAPIVAYQFNPLENANVFSNDASQLLPTAALGGSGGRAYVVAGWPQTIATSSDPKQNFGLDLRAFLAIVGTQADTKVRVKTTARVVPGGPFADGIALGGEAEFVLQPFEVMNLDTGDFNADFTGTLIDADGPIAVFSGSEASDAPYFDSLATRSCCADHLEEQNTPIRAVGKRYVLTRMPNRVKALRAAGANLSPFDREPEFYRVVAATNEPTQVTTTLPIPYDSFRLAREGDVVTLVAYDDFSLEASAPVLVTDTQASQEAAGIARGLPGGDPSLVFVAPVEQWRSDYVLLTPDKYSFDFLVLAVPTGGSVMLDGLALGSDACDISSVADSGKADAGGAYSAYRCSLSFPIIDPAQPGVVLPGRQNDGVHRLQGDRPFGVIVYGFDAYVSYAYSGGTDLREINVR
jgi:hypothetical protein